MACNACRLKVAHTDNWHVITVYSRILVLYFKYVLQLWDLTSGKLLHDFKQHTAASTCVEFHPKEFLLATASNDRFVPCELNVTSF